MTTFSAVLLVGGESRRMGCDKATMEFEGRPLWQRQLEILRALRPEKILVSSREKPTWLPEDTELIVDDPPSRGPLGGVAKALTAMRTTHLIVLAVDMPFMSAEQVRLLSGLVQPGRGVVPLVQGRPEPLAAIYPAAAATNFYAALGGTDFSLQAAVRRLAAEDTIAFLEIPIDNEHLYRSVNEPSDLKVSQNSMPEFR